MPLPQLIEIVPLNQPVRAGITVPGSKSITNRALILAALAEGEVTLLGALWSEDTQIMVECLQELGFMVNVDPDPNDLCNRTITVYGRGGTIPPGGTEDQPMELFVGNAGTAARFLAAFVCLGKGVYRLHGVPRMHERPQAALFKSLRELGYRVESEVRNDKLPARIWGVGSGNGPSGSQRSCSVSIDESSQFASALLLSGRTGNWEVKINGENADESPYVAMTMELIKAFPHRGGEFQIEPDASSGSYFEGAMAVVPRPFLATAGEENEMLRFTSLAGHCPIPDDPALVEKMGPLSLAKYWETWVEGIAKKSGDSFTRDYWHSHSFVSVCHWPHTGWQIDEAFPGFLPLPRWISRKDHLGDSIMTAIVLAPFSQHEVKFTQLGRLRVQECERVVALRTELTKCGAKVVEADDTLTVYPSPLHGAEIETYNDHRMAMCFAILGLKIPGIKIKNPACVKKTFPNFFQKLAAPPPQGLGATVLDASGRPLGLNELFAD